MTALCILLALALVALLVSRIHFHFSFTLTISRSPKATRKGNTSREGERRGNTSGEVEARAVNTSRSGGTSRNNSVAVIRDQSVTKALEAARQRAESDIASALLNLGCKREKALDVAKRAMVEGGKEFTTRLQWALQNAA